MEARPGKATKKLLCIAILMIVLMLTVPFYVFADTFPDNSLWLTVWAFWDENGNGQYDDSESLYESELHLYLVLDGQSGEGMNGEYDPDIDPHLEVDVRGVEKFVFAGFAVKEGYTGRISFEIPDGVLLTTATGPPVWVEGSEEAQLPFDREEKIANVFTINADGLAVFDFSANDGNIFLNPGMFSTNHLGIGLMADPSYTPQPESGVSETPSEVAGSEMAASSATASESSSDAMISSVGPDDTDGASGNFIPIIVIGLILLTAVIVAVVMLRRKKNT